MKQQDATTHMRISISIPISIRCALGLLYLGLALRDLGKSNKSREDDMERKFKWIEINPNVCHGKPVFKGTRVLVADILEMIASGMSIEEILEEYPQLNKEMILEAIALAAELLRRERRVIPISA